MPSERRNVTTHGWIEVLLAFSHFRSTPRVCPFVELAKPGDISDVDFFNRLPYLHIFLLHVEECARSISLAPSILQIMVRTPFSAAENGPSFTSPTVAVLSSISLATRAPMRRQRSRSAWPSAFVLTRHPPHRGNSVSLFPSVWAPHSSP